MAETGDTRGKRAAYIGIYERQLGRLVEILIMHIVNKVQGIHVYTCQPFHHIVETWHEFIVCNDVALYRS